MDREELLILLDNYRQAIQNIQGMEDCILSESILLANIVKINYIYLKSENYEELRKLAEQSVSLATSTKENLEKYKWYLEITSILKELRKRKEDLERYKQENFENTCREKQKEIFDEIEKYRQKSNLDFIKFVLDKYPPNKSPLRNKTVEDNWKENKKSFVEKLSARYNPDNYPRNTDKEKIKFTIYHQISIEINSILSELSNTNSLKE